MWNQVLDRTCDTMSRSSISKSTKEVSQTIHTGKTSESEPATEGLKLAGKLGAPVGIREAYIDKMLRASTNSACERDG